MPLVPCPTCFRHARLEEPRCPFCSASFDDATQLTRVNSVRAGVPAALGLKRAFMYAIGTGTLALTACEGATNEVTAQVGASASSERELPVAEPEVEYELQWRTLSDEELAAIVYPKTSTPKTEPSAPKSRRVRAPPRCVEEMSDPMYGGCL